MAVATSLKTPFRFLLGAILLLAPPSLASAATGDAIQSPLGSAGLALVEAVDGYVLEDAAGTRTRIPVAPGTRLSAIRELEDGWIAAGSISLERVSDLVLVQQRGLVQEAIAAPVGESALFRLDPEPLVEAGELVGLAWLEGDDGEANAVKAASWNGEYWGAIETVAPAVHEAQLALGSAVLDDGSWLLVWAAVHEGDDDIFWSRRHGAEWSLPRKLHADNAVPDIVPAVVGVPGGALAAWSSFDGSDYRLKLAHFDGKSWRDTGFSGERGSLFPGFFETPAGVGCLYTSVVPRTWTVLELAASGTVDRRAMAERESEPRPMIHSPDQDGIRMRWPGPETEGAAVLRDVMERRIEWAGER
jgi:hypothetical protein